MPTIVRQASLIDAPDIAAFHVRVWRVAYQGSAPKPIVKKLGFENRLAYWTKKLGVGDPHHHTLLAIKDTILIGFAHFGPPTDPVFGAHSGPKGEIKHLFIDPNHQGQGLGKRLLHAAFDQLAKDGFTATGLAVTQDNKPAIAFYHAMGGTITDQFTDAGPIWKSENYIMSWPLPFSTKH